MNYRNIVSALALAGSLAAMPASADTFGTAIGGGVGAIAGAVIGDSMGGRNGAIIGSGVGGAVGAVVGQRVSQPRYDDYGYGRREAYRVDHHHYYYDNPGRGHAWGHYKHCHSRHRHYDD